jgi:YidC/Oxa1 family membrane protein insertase
VAADATPFLPTQNFATQNLKLRFMDRKSIIVLIISFALILLWPKLMHELYPPPPKSTNTVVTATNQLATNISTSAIAVATNALTTNGSSAIPQIKDDAPEQLLVITNENAIYNFTSRGGGLKSVQLRKYPETIDCGKTSPGELRLATLNARAFVPTLAWIGGDSAENGSFHLSQSGETIRAEKSLSNGLVVIKEFQVSSNYLLNAKVRLENRSAKTMTISPHELVIGTATPMSNARDETITMGMFWYNGSKAEHIKADWFANRSILSCVGMGGAPRAEFQDGASNVVWAAVHNQFFTLAVIPREAAPKIIARQIQLPIDEGAVVDAKVLLNTNGIQTSLAYLALTLTANQGMERQYTIYAGPKEYNNLARIGNEMNNNLDAVMDFGFFGFFAKMLLLSMNGLHALGITYGFAIIAITVIIKLIFWPLTKASTKSMKRMQALQPQMKAIAEKYKDDPMKKNQKTMEFMKEHKVSPLGGCLPMVLQIPVFFGFYTMIRSAIELRGASFLWACDLSQADTVAHIAGFPINVLPLIYGVTLLWSAQLTPVSPGVDPAQQKMMKYMPVMFLLFLYKMAAGLTLYWTVQNLLTIAQLKLTKTQDEPVGTVTVVSPKKKK